MSSSIFLSPSQTDFRFYWLQTKVEETEGLSEIASINPVSLSTTNSLLTLSLIHCKKVSETEMFELHVNPGSHTEL